jgi:hypothetical protein
MMSEYSYLKLKGVNYPLALYTHLFTIGERKYSDYFPTSQKYNTKKTGFNSKNRMGYLLFKRIIDVYLKLFFDELLSTGVTIKLPIRELFSMKIQLLEKTDYSFLSDSSLIHNHVILSVYFFDKYMRIKLYPRIYPTHKFRNMIVEAYKNGTKYDKFNNDIL